MELVFYEKKFDSLIADYILTEEQLNYTDTPQACIEKQIKDITRHSILAMENNNLVTFFTLHEKDGVKPYSENTSAILLRAFSTDFRFLGQGHAKKALKLLPEFTKSNFPNINEIVLAVNVGNSVAQSLYEKCGFVDYGVRREGSKGELIIMSLYLSHINGQ
ncbi:GNAT family N-acetyltransferase [Bacillus ndiopicus]|uniref:GNAT family N-acetyltransferase n=1 Tax=Bacillus ndiopicus TaxID=1347368 RepID=UPI0005A60A79|nr:GNAT family protein [Bacillus ndiopicus]